MPLSRAQVEQLLVLENSEACPAVYYWAPGAPVAVAVPLRRRPGGLLLAVPAVEELVEQAGAALEQDFP
eukprot:1278302-Lingulodinium_polyedra.AAC.1